MTRKLDGLLGCHPEEKNAEAVLLAALIGMDTLFCPSMGKTFALTGLHGCMFLGASQTIS